uniref:Uncharacterized protein n=1 Tax=Anguilla anguilla TaxID=7936 RepID=A0A0E9P928_ANGAN
MQILSNVSGLDSKGGKSEVSAFCELSARDLPWRLNL